MRLIKASLITSAVIISTSSFAERWESLFPVEIASCEESQLGKLQVFALAQWGAETERQGKALVLFSVGENTAIYTATYFGREGGSFDIASPSAGLKFNVKQGENYASELQVGSTTSTMTCSGKW